MNQLTTKLNYFNFTEGNKVCINEQNYTAAFTHKTFKLEIISLTSQTMYLLMNNKISICRTWEEEENICLGKNNFFLCEILSLL